MSTTLDTATEKFNELVTAAREEGGAKFEDWLTSNTDLTLDDYQSFVDETLIPYSMGDFGVAGAIGFQIGFEVGKATSDSTETETAQS